ncbi:hypothetical protein [Streptantibioticus cattleyicolor]|uniref:Uncharacterized protein n=1 Tax=Streptantibioticus cattleyicolor (strain ATCC 35852 / DSM 46488 / JCM 4925 / NBRC 14057 / NRRL 8057) TaxID=1003195 RepID=F8JMC2_STREN|nr:hypothetical protein [Streptantibioticus cattleyicolor]AEW99244.1 hypothetical protein SCATT_p10510 [Streptantibioticus cattleyicolor NRRL 8057 = DSM 46488]CCB71713.1 Conserved hypotheitcal protein [Streptantibioticus cattleyicolor NRRL 8057 = DSM 46488]
MEALRVIVDPPAADGGRRVWVGHETVGLAYCRADVLDFLRRAGLDPERVRLEDAEQIEWHGGGPGSWGARE